MSISDFDFERFNETAAWLQYCDGMSRFMAETEAARRQGVARYDAIRMGHSEAARDRGQAHDGDAAHHVPRVQPHAAQQGRQMPIGDVQTGRGSVDVLALPVAGR